jgi:hypothetical protein
MIDAGAGMNELGSASDTSGNSPQTTITQVAGQEKSASLAHVIDTFKTTSNVYKAVSDFSSHDYEQALGNSAEAIATVWGKFNPYVALGSASLIPLQRSMKPKHCYVSKAT